MTTDTAFSAASDDAAVTGRRRPGIVLRTAVAIVAAGAFFAGCSSEEATVDSEEMETEISEQLGAGAPDEEPPTIECPEDIAAEVGETTECELSVEGDDEVYPVAVEITSIDGDDVKFSAEVGDEPIE